MDPKAELPPALKGLHVEVRVDGEILHAAPRAQIVSEVVQRCVREISARVVLELYRSLDVTQMSREIRDKVVNEQAENFLKGLVDSDELTRLRTLLTILGVPFDKKGGN